MNELNRRSSEGTIKALQVIIAAMAAGVVAFQLVALFVPPSPPGGPPMVSYVAGGFAPVAVAASFILPAAILRSMRARLAAGAVEKSPASAPVVEEAQLVQGLATATIMGCATLEGAALLGVVAYMIERNPFVLAAVVVLVALLLVRFPTRAGVDRWIAGQRRLMTDARGRP